MVATNSISPLRASRLSHLPILLLLLTPSPAAAAAALASPPTEPSSPNSPNSPNGPRTSSERRPHSETPLPIMPDPTAATPGPPAAAAPPRTRTLQLLPPSSVVHEIRDPVDPTALSQSRSILDELRLPSSGSGSGTVDPTKLMEVARRLGDIPADDGDGGGGAGGGGGGGSGGGYSVSLDECRRAYESLPSDQRKALSAVHSRIKSFAEAQRGSVQDLEVDIPGGRAGHTVSPCRAAGCYAPGGRYPLPSSVLMTAATARAAGCDTVIVASPRPAPATLAAAYLAKADLVLRVGGAQAIAAMAYGVIPPPDKTSEDGMVEVPPCDVIVGPGNRWVTAAKSLVSGPCGIDMLAGPSEVLVIADKHADPEIIASDLIAQAEHDVVARAILLSDDQKLIDDVDEAVAYQLSSLPEPNRSTATEAFKQSFAVKCASIEECVRISDAIAPEHLEIQTADAMKVGMACRNYGGLFVGERAAEVLGDYGAGPNHTLPTGGTGRYTGGLSVFNFLRIRTWMRVDSAEDSQGMVDDSVVLARVEGLEGHARAAEARSLTVEPVWKKKKGEENGGKGENG